MSYFKAKMHQIRFRMGLRPRPRWESLQRSPDPLAGFKGPTSKERGGMEGRGRKGRGGDRRERRGGQGRAGEGAGRERGGREGKGRRGAKGWGRGRDGKENGDRPPTIFGLKVALQ